MNAPNPKKAYGDKKPALHLLPLAGMIHQSLAHLDGDYKYGFENWNEDPVEKLTYIGAILRHVELYKYGETHARDTGVHNLGAVMACCAILLDAELNGKLIDNTRHSKETCDLLHTAEHIVTRLKEAQAAREAAKEQERIDQSWADAANERVQALSKVVFDDATARQQGLNIDGSPRRETFMIDDAGGDAPAAEFKLIQPSSIETVLYSKPVEDKPFAKCEGCNTEKACKRVGECSRG